MRTRDTALVLVITLVGIGLGLILADTALFGLLLGILTAFSVSRKHGYSTYELLHMIKWGTGNGKIILMIMSLIGVLSAAWMMSGTTATLMNLGLYYLPRLNGLFAIFVITSIISMILGTSIGAISIVGISFMEIGGVMGIPLPWIAGAVISGAYVGDRSSPISSSANLTANMTNTNVLNNIKKTMNTLIPIYLLAGLLYFWMGSRFLTDDIVDLHIRQTMAALAAEHTVHWMMLIPPLLLMLLALIRVPIIYCIISGIISSIFLMIPLNTDFHGIIHLVRTLIFGYFPDGTDPVLLSGGGWVSMWTVLSIILLSTALNGILEHTGMIKPLIEEFEGRIKSGRDLIFKTSLLCILINTVTCNQSLSIIIPGRFLKSTYQKHHLRKEDLVRTIADSSVVTVPLIPWNVNAVAIVSILGVSTVSYLPFSFLSLGLPVITVLYGYGMKIRERSYEKEKGYSA